MDWVLNTVLLYSNNLYVKFTVEKFLCSQENILFPNLFSPLQLLTFQQNCNYIILFEFPFVFLSMKWSEVKLLSHIRFFVTPQTIVYKASLSMEFSRQEYRSGLPFPSPRHLPDLGIEPSSPTLQADTLPSEPPVSIILKKKRSETIETKNKQNPKLVEGKKS